GRRQARALGAIENARGPVRAEGFRPRAAHARKRARRIHRRNPGADSARAGRHRDHRRRRAGHAFGLRADVPPDARGVATGERLSSVVKKPFALMYRRAKEVSRANKRRSFMLRYLTTNDLNG